MIQKYGLEDDEWFKRLYSIREKWCTAFNKDFFSAGILSSQRSESTNHAVGFKANKTTTLTDFYAIFKATVNRWRREEEKDDFNCTTGIPKSDLCMSSLLKHASTVYTHTLFRDFEEEFKYAMASDVEMHGQRENILTYRVFINGISGSSQYVQFNHPDKTLNCGCKNFEESGWLCFHCIRVLHLHSIPHIPDRYISKRWSRFAKKDVWEKYDNGKRATGKVNDFTPWRLHMIRRYYNLILKSHRIEAARTVIEESFKQANITVEEIIKDEENKAAEEQAQQAEQAGEGITEMQRNKTDRVGVLDPDRATTKGKDNKRLKGSYDSYKRSSKRAKHRHKEFGSKTPIIPKEHLF